MFQALRLLVMGTLAVTLIVGMVVGVVLAFNRLTAARRCAACGARVGPAAKFCSRCGKPADR